MIHWADNNTCTLVQWWGNTPHISTMVHTFLYYRITYSDITQNFQNIKSCWSVINCHWSSSKSILISIIFTKISGSKVKFPICILVFVKIIEIYKFLHKNNSQMEKTCWFFSYKNQMYIYKIHWTDSRLIIKIFLTTGKIGT
jgi:hypothetical protein